jgi:hypothetical protein
MSETVAISAIAGNKPKEHHLTGAIGFELENRAPSIPA